MCAYVVGSKQIKFFLNFVLVALIFGLQFRCSHNKQSQLTEFGILYKIFTLRHLRESSQNHVCMYTHTCIHACTLYVETYYMNNVILVPHKSIECTTLKYDVEVKNQG